MSAPISLESMRRDIAALIHLDPEEVGCDDHLGDLGLDSMRLMTLILGWQEAGVQADFGAFAEYYTLGEWWQVVQGLTPEARG